MMDEIMLFFRGTYPLYVLFTPLAVVSISVLLVMMMITPYDNEAAKYKEYIKYVCWAWVILQFVPTVMILCINYAVDNNAFTWAVDNAIH